MTPDETVKSAVRHLRGAIGLTHMGLIAERTVHSFWPVAAIVLATLSLLMLGIQDELPVEAVWAGGVLSVGGGLWALWRGGRAFRWPTRADAARRIDATLPGRPISSLTDQQAIGAGDEASQAVWEAHQKRMADKLKDAKAVEPDLRVSSRDPFALRYVAAVAFVIALIFGSVLRVSSVAEMAPGSGTDLATGPTWEGWVEPPTYTGRPSLYLNDIDPGPLAIPEGSQITIRLYGEVGGLLVEETISGRTGEVASASAPAQDFTVTQSGTLSLSGPGGASWDVSIIEDEAPTVELMGRLERTATGEFRQPFRARDDYGVVSGMAELTLDVDRVTRRFGLTIDPEPRDPIALDLPMSISGSRTDFDETLIENLAKHPFANLPIQMNILVEDALGQQGGVRTEDAVLPGRRFFDPLAAAVIEQRRDLLWNRKNAQRVSQVLRAVSYRPDEVFRSETAFLKLRVAIRRLEAGYTYDTLTDDLIEETAEVLWEIAVQLEDGDLSDALERLRRAQDRLSEAIENGATDDEIAQLMQELREAMQDYMRQLAEQSGQQDNNQQAQNNQDTQEITGDQLQEMLDRLQQLMEEGRTAEAQELLEQLRQMMENMQVTQGQQGQQGQQSEGQQAMEGLAETLRQQQGLSDEAFGDLQEQFNPNNQPGQQQQGQQQGQQQPGQQQGQGQQPGQQGQQPGQGQQFGQGQGGQPGQQPGQGQDGDMQGSLADRQQALRNELQRQQNNLPGAGTPEGEAARDALDRAGRAMEGAEEALRNEDFAEALDNQADAIEALREGMRELGEQLAQQQQQGQQGDQVGNADPNGRRDPLGREAGETGRIGTDEQLLQGEDVFRRARELLDEIRRRSGDQSRPDQERDYLKRLLDRF